MLPEIFSVYIPWLDITFAPRYYGLFYAVSIFLAYQFALREFPRRGFNLNADQVMNYLLLIFISGMVGARAYYVILELPRYLDQPWWKMLAIWEGGLAIHGGFLGAWLSTWFYAYRTKVSFYQLADINCMALTIGQVIGRWGNFTNGEIGGPVTNSWVGLVFPPEAPINLYAQGRPVHPTMIYESLSNLVLLLILWRISRKTTHAGLVAVVYIIGYGLIRIALTPWRIDNQYFVLMGEAILAPYVISVVLIAIALGIGWHLKFWQKQPQAQAQMKPAKNKSKNKKKK